MDASAASLGQLAVRAGVLPADQARRLVSALRARASTRKPTSLGRLLVKGGMASRDLRALLRTGADLHRVVCDGCGAAIPQAELPERREYPCKACGAMLLGFAAFQRQGARQAAMANPSTQRFPKIIPLPSLDVPTPGAAGADASTVAFANPEGQTVPFAEVLTPADPEYIYEVPSGSGLLSEEETILRMEDLIRASEDEAPPLPRRSSLAAGGVSNRELAGNDESLSDKSFRMQLSQRKIGGFQLLRSLGKGAVGRVFLAQEPKTGRKVALKVLRSEAAQDTELVSRFEREARVSGLVKHPNVVELVASGYDEALGIPYLALEYLEGGSLLDLLRTSEQVDPTRALKITRGVCLALQAAAAHGVVHRDIKPENILFGPGEVPKLADLGLAKLAEQQTQITETGFVVGTPCYIAPEQATGEEDIDIRADLFALGFCLWQMLTGVVPFSDDDDAAPMDLIIRHLEEDLPDPRLYAHTISDGVAQVVRGLTARERERRYRSPAHVVRDIDLVLAGDQPLSASDASLPRPLSLMVEELKSSASREGLDALSATQDAPSPSSSSKPAARASGGSAGWIVVGLISGAAILTLSVWAGLWIRHWLQQGPQ